MRMTKSYFFIVNPCSNSGRTGKNWSKIFLPEIQKKFKNFKWIFTKESGDACLLATLAKKQKYDVVVAVGGDGTINEVVNGLMEDVAKRTPTLACLPAGTGCDLIKTLGMPRDFTRSLEIILEGHAIDSDVGLMKYTKNQQEKNRYFINIAGCGANGDIAQKINGSKKYFGSTLSFLFASLKNILRNDCPRVLISFDDEPAFEVDLRVLFVCNAQYCGAGMRVGPQAQMNDGFFSVNLIRKTTILKTLLSTPRVYSGNFQGLEHFIHLRNTKKIRVTSLEQRPIFVECDGEQPGILPAEFTFTDKKLFLIAKPQ